MKVLMTLLILLIGYLLVCKGFSVVFGTRFWVAVLCITLTITALVTGLNFIFISLNG